MLVCCEGKCIVVNNLYSGNPLYAIYIKTGNGSRFLLSYLCKICFLSWNCMRFAISTCFLYIKGRCNFVTADLKCGGN